MGIGPIPATEKLIARLGIKVKDFDVIELNEAFASQSLACMRGLGLADDAAQVNPNGGAIALGHPLGMSGTRITGTALHALEEMGGKRALATMCVGVGPGRGHRDRAGASDAKTIDKRADFGNNRVRGALCAERRRSMYQDDFRRRARSIVPLGPLAQRLEGLAGQRRAIARALRDHEMGADDLELAAAAHPVPAHAEGEGAAQAGDEQKQPGKDHHRAGGGDPRL